MLHVLTTYWLFPLAGCRPNFKRWLDAIGERPAVKRGVAVMADLPQEPLDEAERSIITTPSNSSAAADWGHNRMLTDSFHVAFEVDV